jgi:undecaprenyl-diphosphatase
LDLPDLVILALTEGVADILPIDATAHALLVSKLVGWRAGTITTAIHLGAAAALLLYLWRDIATILQGLWKLRRARIEPGTSLLAKALVCAAPWLAAVGVLGAPPVPGLSDMLLVGTVTLIAAVVMGVVDKLSMTVKRIEHLGGATALAIGVSQLFALVPGVGRVAVALTTARLLGLERPDAFRFVLLSNIPILLAAGGRSGISYYLQGVRPATSDILALTLTFVFVLVAVPLAMAWIRRRGLLPFTFYRLALGAGLIALGFV